MALRQSARENAIDVDSTKKKEPTKDAKRDSRKTERPRKLKFKEKQELERLPARIEELENEIASMHEQMADPGFYQQAGDVIAKAQEDLKQLDDELAIAYSRWEELEEIAAG